MKKIVLLSLSVLTLLPLYSQNDCIKRHKTYQVMETDIMPSFEGGYSALSSFIYENLTYPKIYEDASIQGTVICHFIVEPNGSISSIKVIRGVDKPLDEEVIRVLKLMPKWTPGKLNGKAVSVDYFLPVKCHIK